MNIPVPLPPAVLPGDRVGVAALSGPVNPERLAAGLEALRGLGFEPVLARNLGAKQGYLAGSDAERLAAFHELASDPSLTAIVFARGGYGVMRLLEAIDWDLLARYPRAYVGYSDLTPFLLEVVRRLGFAALHGPMVAADLARGLTAEEERSLLDALAGRLPLNVPVAATLVRGEAQGPILGGCLAMLAASVGTPFSPQFAGAWVLLEDVGERLYRVDRFLTQLRLSGCFDGALGFIVGTLGLEEGERSQDLEPLLLDRLGTLGLPLLTGVPCGHAAPNFTFPLGVSARFDAASGLLVGIS